MTQVTREGAVHLRSMQVLTRPPPSLLTFELSCKMTCAITLFSYCSLSHPDTTLAMLHIIMVIISLPAVLLIIIMYCFT